MSGTAVGRAPSDRLASGPVPDRNAEEPAHFSGRFGLMCPKLWRDAEQRSYD